jgi:hypothetical protein
VFGRLEKAGFTLNPEKIVIDTSEIRYLGHFISSKGIKVLPESGGHTKISATQEFKRSAEIHWDGWLLRQVYPYLLEYSGTFTCPKKKRDSFCLGR